MIKDIKRTTHILKFFFTNAPESSHTLRGYHTCCDFLQILTK